MTTDLEPLLVVIVLVAFSFGTLVMELFCRPILTTRAMSMLWLQFPVIIGYFLLVQMDRYLLHYINNLELIININIALALSRFSANTAHAL